MLITGAQRSRFYFFPMCRLRLLWQIPAALFLMLTFLLLGNELVVARPSKRTKDVPYVAANTPGFDPTRHLLDVYSPRRASATKRPVVVFIHGGSWNSGNKNLYSFIGRRLAKAGQEAGAVVAVVINYRLAPAVEVPAMADDCARAVLWTKQHIADYGGDPDRIFVMGHSAGGGLAALLATDDRLFTRLGLAQKPVRGCYSRRPGGLRHARLPDQNGVPQRPAVFDSVRQKPGRLAGHVADVSRPGR